MCFINTQGMCAERYAALAIRRFCALALPVSRCALRVRCASLRHVFLGTAPRALYIYITITITISITITSG